MRGIHENKKAKLHEQWTMALQYGMVALVGYGNHCHPPRFGACRVGSDSRKHPAGGDLIHCQAIRTFAGGDEEDDD